MKRLLLFGFCIVLITTFVVSCQKELSLETDQNLGHGSLYDSLKSCQPIVVNGTYYNGVPTGSDTNFIQLIVTVTKTGSYTLIADSTNGFGFKNSGYFTQLGLDTIYLQAFGTPILNKPTDFTITLDSSTCGFTVNVQDSTGTGLGGGTGVITGDSSFVDPNPAATNTWHFTDSTSGVTYSGVFDINITNPDSLQGGFLQSDTLYVIGQSSTADTSFGLKLAIPSQTIVPGTIYPITVTNVLALLKAANLTPIYGANDVTAANGSPLGASYITLTSYSNNKLSGSFHVYAQKFDGTLVLIAGSFNCTVQ